MRNTDKQKDVKMAEEKKQESKYFVPNISDRYELTPEAYKEIFRIMNRSRPYCPDDFKKHHFFDNIAENPAEAAMYKQHNEFFIKGY